MSLLPEGHFYWYPHGKPYYSGERGLSNRSLHEDLVMGLGLLGCFQAVLCGVLGLPPNSGFPGLGCGGLSRLFFLFRVLSQEGLGFQQTHRKGALFRFRKGLEGLWG